METTIGFVLYLGLIAIEIILICGIKLSLRFPEVIREIDRKKNVSSDTTDKYIVDNYNLYCYYTRSMLFGYIRTKLHLSILRFIVKENILLTETEYKIKIFIVLTSKKLD